MQVAQMDSSQALALLEKHKKRVESLQSRQTRVQVQLETAREQYKQTVEQAKTQFGTAEVPALEKLLSERIKANNASVEGFVRAVDEFEAHISRIEKALADPVALEEFLQSMPDDQGSEVSALSVGKPSAACVNVFDDEDI